MWLIQIYVYILNQAVSLLYLGDFFISGKPLISQLERVRKLLNWHRALRSAACVIVLFPTHHLERSRAFHDRVRACGQSVPPQAGSLLLAATGPGQDP